MISAPEREGGVGERRVVMRVWWCMGSPKHTGGRLSWIFWSWLTSASSLVPASKFIDTREVAWSAICGAVKTQKGEGWG